MVEELGLLGAKLLPSEGGQAEAFGGSPARLRSVPIRAPSPTPKAGKKSKVAERTADAQALAALELEWREQRKATLSLQLLGLTWQQNAAKIQARPGTLVEPAITRTRGCNPVPREPAISRTRGCNPMLTEVLSLAPSPSLPPFAYSTRARTFMDAGGPG